MNIFESGSAGTNYLVLAVVSTLQKDKAEEYLLFYQQLLRLVLDSKDDATLEDILSPSSRPSAET